MKNFFSLFLFFFILNVGIGRGQTVALPLCEGIHFITKSMAQNKFVLLKGKTIEKDAASSTHASKVQILGFEDEQLEHDFNSVITFTGKFAKVNANRKIVEEDYQQLLHELEQCLKLTPTRDDYEGSLMATFTLKNGVEVIATAFLSDVKEKYIELEIARELDD